MIDEIGMIDESLYPGPVMAPGFARSPRGPYKGSNYTSMGRKRY